jgi:hypothetical protein
VSRCALDVSDPFFLASVGDSPAILAGLEEIRQKVADNHRSCGWVNQPLPGFPEFQNKVWKWVWAPKGDRSATKKGWRLYAYVPDAAAAEPIPATAFYGYDKTDDPGNYPKVLAKKLRAFLAGPAEELVKVEEKFIRRIHNEVIISLCGECFEKVSESTDLFEVEALETTHQCHSVALF